MENEILVAVITPQKRWFLEFVKEKGNKTETYIHIDCIEKIRGIRFKRTEKAYKWYDVEGISDILDYIEKHIVIN